MPSRARLFVQVCPELSEPKYWYSHQSGKPLVFTSAWASIIVTRAEVLVRLTTGTKVGTPTPASMARLNLPETASALSSANCWPEAGVRPCGKETDRFPPSAAVPLITKGGMEELLSVRDRFAMPPRVRFP